MKTGIIYCLCMNMVLFTTGANGNDSGSFWQLTDTHWDFLYSKHGDNTKMCHNNSGEEVSSESLGYYGDISCDSPYHLIHSAIHAMKNISPNPDFILWTGDNAPHTENLNFEIIFETIRNVSAKIDTLFESEVKLIPVLGNHDTFPSNYYPASQNEFYKRYLTEGGWANLLNEDAQKSFEKGGYFAVDVNFGLKVLVLNTNLYRHDYPAAKFEDPSGQFEWVENEFISARRENKRVIVTAHAPPGFWGRNPTVSFFNRTHNEKYVDLLNKNGKLIVAQIYGHEHTDSFRIFRDSSPKSVAFLAPSITPLLGLLPGGTAINPSIRLYHYDSSKIIDVWQYHMNLTEANKNPLENAEQCEVEQCESQAANKLWKLYYKTTEAYGLASLSLENVLEWNRKMFYNDTLFQEYFKRNSAGIEHGYCNKTCKINHLCAVNFQKFDFIKDCLQKLDELGFQKFYNERLSPPKSLFSSKYIRSSTTTSNIIAFISIGSIFVGISVMTFLVVQRNQALGRRSTAYNVLTGYRLLSTREHELEASLLNSEEERPEIFLS